MWAFLAVFSSLFLGIYEVFKKLALNRNAVIPVLFYSSVASSVILMPFFLLSRYYPGFEDTSFFIPVISFDEHLKILVKSSLLLVAWLLAFAALKNLPITIVTPIRATMPLWTLFGAVVVYGEQLNIVQWVGIAVTFFFFILFSMTGSRSGFSFKGNRWMWYILLSVILSASSGVYDKYLITTIDRMSVLAYFTFYHVPMFGALMLFIRMPNRAKLNPFEWRWSIVMVSVMVLLADFFYFYSISMPGALISIITALRSSSVVVAFYAGALVFKERGLKQRSLLLLGILLGVMVVLFATTKMY